VIERSKRLQGVGKEELRVDCCGFKPTRLSPDVVPAGVGSGDAETPPGAAPPLIGTRTSGCWQTTPEQRVASRSSSARVPPRGKVMSIEPSVVPDGSATRAVNPQLVPSPSRAATVLASSAAKQPVTGVPNAGCGSTKTRTPAATSRVVTKAQLTLVPLLLQVAVSSGDVAAPTTPAPATPAVAAPNTARASHRNLAYCRQPSSRLPIRRD
jgi:hypothetical protein